MTVDDKDLGLTEDELAQARFAERNSRSRLNDTMDDSFLSPKRAMNRIQNARARLGDGPTFDKLRDPKSRAFGRRPGSLLSRQALQKGAGQKRRDALLARRRLPKLLQNHEHDSTRLRGAERAAKEARARRKPTQEKPQRSFMERLKSRKPQPAVPSPYEPQKESFLGKILAKNPPKPQDKSRPKIRPRKRGLDRER
ncbi:hypothetical protein [Roseibium aggregatum]|uniref:hypothetical protein n=1 Tax=Roseibium aggregatum TaxID=187304 RepID=UPI00058B275B|nr:hypothetical protein [Roseibium aggregatum]